MECNLACVEINLGLFKNLYSPLIYPELGRDDFITERRYNPRKTMTNLYIELSIKCTFLGLLQQKCPAQIFTWQVATSEKFNPFIIDHSGMYLLKKGRGSLGNVTLLIDESMLINNVHFREFSFRNKRVTLWQVSFFRQIISARRLSTRCSPLTVICTYLIYDFWFCSNGPRTLKHVERQHVSYYHWTTTL